MNAPAKAAAPEVDGKIPLVDLGAQYAAHKDELDAAVAGGGGRRE